jgi:hypothetical protein
LAVLERLQGTVLVRHAQVIRARDFEVVTEDAVEADLERGYTRGSALFDL